MVHKLIEGIKLQVGVQYKSSIHQENITFIEHEVLYGAWLSTLWFVKKANTFYPAFI